MISTINKRLRIAYTGQASPEDGNRRLNTNVRVCRRRSCLGEIPYFGDAVAAGEAFTGKSSIRGEELGGLERGLAAASVIPGGKVVGVAAEGLGSLLKLAADAGGAFGGFGRNADNLGDVFPGKGVHGGVKSTDAPQNVVPFRNKLTGADVHLGQQGLKFGDNLKNKIGQKLNQLRKKYPDVRPAKSGGIDDARRLARERVAQGGGRVGPPVGQGADSAIYYDDGPVTWVFRPNGEFWSLRSNPNWTP